MKKLNACLIIVLFLASTAAFYAPKRASAAVCTTVTMNPSQQDSWMYNGNGSLYEISVDIVITNLTGMAGWQFGLFWNNLYLNCDGVVIYNPSIWTGTVSVNISQGVNNSYNSTNGYYCYAIAAIRNSPTFNGTLTIATLMFHQLANVSATTPLSLDSVEICDKFGNDINYSSTDGSILMHTGAKPTTITICGNGSTIQLFPDPSNWTNWQCSQTGDNDTSYVSTGSGGNEGMPGYDLYNASSPWIPSNATNVVISVHIVVRSISSSHKATFYTTLNTTATGFQSGGSFTPTTTYQDDCFNYTIMPSDGASLQIGVYISPAAYRHLGVTMYFDGYCTQVYAIIIWS